MKKPIPFDQLPTPEETKPYVARERRATEGGPNWAAVSAAFVCPGAGQFLCGQKAAGIAFLSMFVIAVLISFIPLGAQLLASVQSVVSTTAPQPGPMPWFAILSGLALALLVWITAMIHAALLSKK